MLTEQAAAYCNNTAPGASAWIFHVAPENQGSAPASVLSPVKTSWGGLSRARVSALVTGESLFWATEKYHVPAEV